jgi:hypothetical protein
MRPGCPNAVTELCPCGDLKRAKTIERSFEASRRGRVEGLRKSTSHFETWMPSRRDGVLSLRRLEGAKAIERSFETSRRGRVEGLRKSTSRFETGMP